jgi:hypothetical protein
MHVQKARKLCQRASGISEGGNNDHLSQLQGHSSGLAAEVGEVVFVAFADLFDYAMHTQTFEKACDLTGGFVREVFVAQLLIGEPADEELALQQGAK